MDHGTRKQVSTKLQDCNLASPSTQARHQQQKAVSEDSAGSARAGRATEVEWRAQKHAQASAVLSEVAGSPGGEGGAR